MVKNTKKLTGSKAAQLELRTNFRFLLLQNPNYFGNLSEAGIKSNKASLKIFSDTDYEELSCISFNPKSNELSGIVKVKQTGGYGGGECTDGSKEYVRFYVDYNNDGTWVDEGAVNFDAHNLPFSETLCYAVTLKLDPDKRSCCKHKPVLPRVRGVLSWNNEPPPNQPNWLPVWGNRLEADIQIAPRTGFFCHIWDFLLEQKIDIDPIKLEPLVPLLKSEIQPAITSDAQLFALKESYGKDVEDTRLGFKSMYSLSKKSNDIGLISQVQMLKTIGLDITKISDFLIKPKFNTGYEEIKCVGLDRDLSALHGSVQVKKASGFSGGLCTNGSQEYVAFYLDFGSGWKHMGTSSVDVHDIPNMPANGLWYNVKLPVSLSKHQLEWCQTGKAKIRAILSWNVPPTPNDPDYKAHWGDWEECNVEIRPLPIGVKPGEPVPVIESLGSMPVSMINASGYANGINSTGLVADDSPFDGNILINGIIAFAPDSTTSGVSKARYRLWVKKPSAATFQEWLGKFNIGVTTISGGVVGPQVIIPQIPDPLGWVDYYPDYVIPDLVSVDRNLLGVFRPSEAGLHELYVEVFDPNTAITNVSNVVKFMVDRTSPNVDVEITSGTGNCGKFGKGETIVGSFSISDDHCHSMTLSVTPTDEANGEKPEIVGSGGLSSLSYASANLPTVGTSGTWELDTTNMDPCGYNIRIHGVDRTIVNSNTVGHRRSDIEGFCLEE